GSVTISDIDNDTKAYISNMKGAIGNNTEIIATNEAQAASLAGGVGVSSTLGIGASVAYNNIHNDVYANAVNSNYEQLGSLKINAVNGQHNDEMDTVDELRNDISSSDTTAKDKMDIISLGVSAGVSKTLSIAGTVSYNIIDNNINASMENTNFINYEGAASISKGPIEVKALNEADIISLSGAVGVSGTGGFAAAVGINRITGGTRSSIIDSIIPTSGKIDNHAYINSFIVGLGVGVAVVSDSLNNLSDCTSDVNTDGLGSEMETGSTDKFNKKEMPKTGASPGDNSGKEGGSFGIGISGSVSINLIDAEAVTSIVNTKSAQTDLEAGAVSNINTNKSDIYSLAGAVAINASSGGSGAVMSGAVSYNSIKGKNNSFISNLKIHDAGNLYVDSQHSGTIYSLAVGGAGASFQSKGVVLAGSVTINSISSATDAYLENCAGDVGGDTSVKSNNGSKVRTLSGGIAAGASVGIGLAASVSLLNGDTQANINNSNFNLKGSLVVGASNGTDLADQNELDILALALSAGISQYAGLGTCAVVSVIGNETHAKITNSQINIDSDKDLDMKSIDYSDVISIAGGVGGSTGGGALGAAVSYNEIGGSVDAVTDGSIIKTEGAVNMASDADGQIKSVAAGLSMSRYASLAGSATLNLIKRDVISNVINSSIAENDRFAKSVSVKADENSDVISLAGSAGLVGDVAVGASVAYNELKNNVKAFIESSKVLSGGNLDVEAKTSGKVKSCSAGAAVAAAVEGEIPVGVGIAASVSLNLNKKAVEAYINKCLNIEGHLIKSNKEVNVNAIENTEFTTVGGMLDFGLTAGLGGSVEFTNLNNGIRTHITDSDVIGLSKVA
ncbi:MAG: hypothetical protein Q8942_19660, partial [Bacillota bacterium]|nr:hypothetical protein [Bacillota bacterium]